jgi:hypothetical protein
MGRPERVALIKQIEEERKSKVVVYFCGDRPLLSARIADDALRHMYDHLRALGPFPEKVRRLDFYLYSIGGVMETPWKVVTMLREFCDELHIVIPYKAYSAATLLALGGDKIWMTAKAELGPVDPALDFTGAGDKPSPFVLRDLGVEDVASYVKFLKERAGLKDQAALSANIAILAQTLTPPLLGRIERIYTHIRLVASKLLELCKPPLEKNRITSVVEALTEKTYVHGHGIGRREAKQIGLHVESLEDPVASKVWDLFLQYEEWLKLQSPMDYTAYFPDPNVDTYEEKGAVSAVIESVNLCHSSGGDFRLRQIRKVPQQPAINLNVNLGLPPNIDPAQIPQQAQQVLQQLLQQAGQQIQRQVAEEIARQSPVERVEGALVGAQWRKCN